MRMRELYSPRLRVQVPCSAASPAGPQPDEGTTRWTTHSDTNERCCRCPHAGGPLTDIRIIDLTAALAGPFCTMLLADLGADVIKVEPPKGDFTRYGGPFTKGDTEHHYGGYFASVNRSKRSIVLDLQQEADRETLRELVRDADVIVENFRVGVLDKLGLGYEALAEINPRLVYGAVRGFGDPRTGESPYADWPAFDVVAQAMSGLTATTGAPGTFGTRIGPSVGDIYPGHAARARDRLGRPRGAGVRSRPVRRRGDVRRARRPVRGDRVPLEPLGPPRRPARQRAPDPPAVRHCSPPPTVRSPSPRRPITGRSCAR